ncbi:MAG: flagellar biosynthetic protein FliO [Oscillospiraceae bacterium]|nr:flagellar biosynthetic protein FliO [Oscillospiraceae bacterium]
MLWALIGATEGAARFSSPGGEGFQSLFVGLLGFAALLALLYFGLKFLTRRGRAAARGNGLRVLDRMAVSRENMILVIQVAGRILTVGVTKDGMSALCELTREEWEASRAPASASVRSAECGVLSGETSRAPASASGAFPASEAPGVRGFWRRFAHNLGVYAGVLPKGTPAARPPSASPSETGGFDAWLRRAASAQAAETPPADASAARADSAEAPPIVHMTPTVSATPAAAEAHRVDYNVAIERMKQFGRMERPAQRTPLGGFIPPTPFGTPPAPPTPAAGLGEDPLESVLNRMTRRTDRLARIAAREDRRKAE